MKKCPMMFNLQFTGGGWHKPQNCIGAQCAAYMEREQKYTSTYGGCSIEPCHEWSCAMTPREVWHDVENS